MPKSGLRLIPVVALFVGGALLRLHFALERHRPVLFADEVAPLLFTRAITGTGGHPTMGADAPYQFGYSVLLAVPTWLFGGDALFRSATVVNALLLAANAPLLYLILRDTLGVERRLALAAAGVASLYPAFLLETGFSWSESAVLTAVLVTYVASHRLLRSPGLVTALAFGASTAAAYAIHARLVPVLVLAPVALFLANRWHGLRALHAAAAGATTAALFVAVKLANGAITSSLYTATPKRNEGSVIAAIVDDPAKIVRALAALAGQSWYLAVATVGLAPLGTLYLLREVKRHPRRVDVLWVLAVTITCLLVAALFIADAGRTDQRIYGRYAETILAVPLAAGLVSLALRRSVLDKLGAMLLFPGLLTGVLLFAVGKEKFQGRLNPLNMLALGQFYEFGAHLRIVWIAFVAIAVGTALTAVRFLLNRAGAALAFGAVTALFVWSALDTQQHVVTPIDANSRAVPSIPATIPLIEEVTGLDIDRIDVLPVPGQNRSALLRYQVERPEVELDRHGASGLPNGPWVFAAASWPAGEAAGARLVVPDGETLALWVMPGREQDRLEERQMLSGDEPLAADDLDARITSTSRSLTIERGERATVDLRIENRGSRPWPSYREGAANGEPIFVRSHWQKAEGLETVWTDTQLLTQRLYPRDVASVAYTFETRHRDGRSAPRGRYLVRFELIQNGQGFAVAAKGPWISVAVSD
jgi:hypothetical protein